MNNNLKYQPHESQQKNITNHTISGKMELKFPKTNFCPQIMLLICNCFLEIFDEVQNFKYYQETQNF